MKDNKKEEMKLFYCVNCGSQQGGFSEDSKVLLKCPKCKKTTIYIFREGQIHADTQPEGGPGVKEPALTL